MPDYIPIVNLESSHNVPLSSNDSIPDSVVNEIRRYEDFSTIDWVEAASRENRLRIKTYQDAYAEKSSRDVEDDSTSSNIFGFTTFSGKGLRYTLIIRQMYSAVQSWLVLALVGSLIGLIAGFLSIVTELLSDFKNGYCSSGLYLNENFCCSGYDEGDVCPEWKMWSSIFPINYFIYIFYSTMFGLISAFLVYSFAPYAAGSGISEIKCIIGGFVMNGFLDLKTLIIKSITLPLTIASGLSVGKEGPSVHYAVCCGNVIAKLFPKYKLYNSKMREVLSACAAAGVAVAFGSPMGGVLFSLEEMTSSFQLKTMWRSYFCALVATGVLASINPFRTGQLVLFSVKYDHDWHFFEIIFFVIIGLFGGFGGLFIIKWNLRVQSFRKKYLQSYAIQEICFLTLITAIICYFNEFLRIDMTESMQILFHECEHGSIDNVTCQISSHKFYLISALFFGCIIRMLLTIVSYGSKVPAGIFVPSMAIGALFGRLLGTLVWLLHESHPHWQIFASCPPDSPCITPGTYALLGSAALLSGVMNITVTVVVITFEVTGALRYILPTMIVVGVTKAVGDYFGPGGGGIADRTITANGYPFLENFNEDEIHHNKYLTDPIEYAMTKELLCIPSKTWTVNEIKHLLDTSNHLSYPVVEENDEDDVIIEESGKSSSSTTTTTTTTSNHFLIGYIWRSELEYIIKHNNSNLDKYINFEISTNASSSTVLNFSRLVNFSPVVVQNNTPISKVTELFSKVGPRVIYVEKSNTGTLCGLLTRKDILKYQHKVDYIISPPNTSAAEEMDQKIWELISSSISKLRQLVIRR